MEELFTKIYNEIDEMLYDTQDNSQDIRGRYRWMKN